MLLTECSGNPAWNGRIRRSAGKVAEAYFPKLTYYEESFFNWGSCLRWRITGICRIVCHRGHCHVWVRVRHWRPDEVAETV
ncbi:MAG: hypothetical protein ACE10H_04690, partial [Candidatus Binatia bacterium]